MKQATAERNLLNMIGAPMGLVREANKYFDTQAPWQLAKEGKDERLRTVLYVSLEAIRVAAALLSPVLPNKTMEIRRAIGVPEDKQQPNHKELEHLRALQPGTPLGVGESIFPRIDKNNKQAAKAGAATAPKAEEPVSEEGLIDIEHFGKVELTVAEVVEAARVEGADRLLQLKVKVGEEERPLVAGIAEYYAPETLVGKHIIIVANLKPAKIRGLESRGMLLAAKKGKKLVLLTTDGEIASGAKIS
jgi:methionyl-tRNA synthetase